MIESLLLFVLLVGMLAVYRLSMRLEREELE